MVRIAVHAAGIGFVDTLVTRGLYQVRQEPPFTPGMEVAGVVESAPADSGRNVGDRVYASLPVGGCAETVWADRRSWSLPCPASLSVAQGAALVVNDHTAHVALTRRAGLRPGESVLVHGAARRPRLGGGAHRRRARRPGDRGGQHRRTPGGGARGRGAPGATGRTSGWTAVRADGGADIIVDPIGGDVFDASLRALAPEGRLLTLGYVSGRIPSAPANRLLLRNSDVRGVNWVGLIAAHPELFRSTADRSGHAAGRRDARPGRRRVRPRRRRPGVRRPGGARRGRQGGSAHPLTARPVTQGRHLTVKSDMRSVLTKLGAGNRVEAIAIAASARAHPLTEVQAGHGGCDHPPASFIYSRVRAGS